MTYQDREISRREVVKTAATGAAVAATAVAVPAAAKAAVTPQAAGFDLGADFADIRAMSQSSWNF